MKLVITVVSAQDADTLSAELSSKKIGATKLKSTGGFLKQKNTTFFIGVEDQRLNQTLALIQKTCGTRTEPSPPRTIDEVHSYTMVEISSDVVAGGATIWVVPLDNFIKL